MNQQPVVVMQYSAEAAAKAGGGDYINEGGPYVGKIKEAKYVTAKTHSQGIEFSFESKDGLKANYISVYYAKAPAAQGQQGEPIKGGVSTLNAIMGVLGLKQITAIKSGDGYICPEFTEKEIGLFLQKKLMTKNDGSDSYGFEIKVPFDPRDNKTMREKLDNKSAETINRMTASYKDDDQRKQKQSGSTVNSGGYDQYPEAGGFATFG